MLMVIIKIIMSNKITSKFFLTYEKSIFKLLKKKEGEIQEKKRKKKC